MLQFRYLFEIVVSFWGGGGYVPRNGIAKAVLAEDGSSGRRRVLRPQPLFVFLEKAQ